MMLQLLICVVALFVIALTMLMSAADLKMKGFRWNVRRVGFVLAGSGSVGMGLGITVHGLDRYHPGWDLVAMLVGIALVFMTNPYQRPWHKWLWKGSLGGLV